MAAGDSDLELASDRIFHGPEKGTVNILPVTGHFEVVVDPIE
jgi:hypothetical protein